jgi:hypothetical protein
MLLGLLLVAFVFSETVITPYGPRPAECVLQVPSDSTVGSHPTIPNLLQINHPTKGSWLHKVPAHCGDDIAAIKARAEAKRNFKPDPLSENVTQINGWLDYGGWYPPGAEGNLMTFTSTYMVPGNPGSMSNQVLFYFIGMQDNDDPGAVNIIQPVLTWGNGYPQWYLASWACCPSNITVHSDYLFGLGPGSTVYGTINRLSASTWSIDSAFNGRHTTLNAQVGDYIYNWADVTLEVYQLDTCPQFATGRATFNALSMKDSMGQTLNPSWQFTGATSCNGRIVQTAPNSIYIAHN